MVATNTTETDEGKWTKGAAIERIRKLYMEKRTSEDEDDDEDNKISLRGLESLCKMPYIDYSFLREWARQKDAIIEGEITRSFKIGSGFSGSVLTGVISDAEFGDEGLTPSEGGEREYAVKFLTVKNGGRISIKDIHHFLHEFVALRDVMRSEYVVKLIGWSFNLSKDIAHVVETGDGEKVAYAALILEVVKFNEAGVNRSGTLLDLVLGKIHVQNGLMTMLTVLRDAVYCLEAMRNEDYFHGDFKPSNILLKSNDDESINGVLTDFGGVGRFESRRPHRAGRFTIEYYGKATPRSGRQGDVRAIGMCLLAILVGSEPDQLLEYGLLGSPLFNHVDPFKIVEALTGSDRMF
jgi:serine/threonine protein kinase